MLSEKALRHELKRLPGLLKTAIKRKEVDTIVELIWLERCIDWVLTDED